jgi:dephospho-CoA kinase
MTQPVIIALTGRKGHGKDTSANIIANEFIARGKGNIAYFAFADILKDIVCRSLSITGEDIEHIKYQPGIKIANGKNFRDYINSLGDILKHYFGYDVWAKKTTKRIEDACLNLKLDLILVTDLRYPIEQSHLQKFCEDNGYDFITIKVINLNKQVEENEHESESLVDEIEPTFTVEAASVEELTEKIKELCNVL